MAWSWAAAACVRSALVWVALRSVAALASWLGWWAVPLVPSALDSVGEAWTSSLRQRWRLSTATTYGSKPPVTCNRMQQCSLTHHDMLLLLLCVDDGPALRDAARHVGGRWRNFREHHRICKEACSFRPRTTLISQLHVLKLFKQTHSVGLAAGSRAAPTAREGRLTSSVTGAAPSVQG